MSEKRTPHNLTFLGWGILARFLAPIWLLLLAGSASAATIYVAPYGDDNHTGTLDKPVRTPGHALDIVAPGDTIQFRAGRYQLSRTLWVAKPGLTLMAFPGEKVQLVAGTEESPANPQAVITIIASHVTVQDLEIEGGSYYGIKIDVENAPSTRGVIIRRCFIHHTGRDAIKAFNADDLIIEECEIAHTGVRDDNAEGIDCIGSISVTIRRNFVHHTRTTGIYIKGGARNGRIERNRVENCGNSGILLGQDTDPEFMRDGTEYEALDSVARNNIVVNTVGAGLGTYSGSNVRFENNTVIGAARTHHAGFYIVMNGRDVPSRQVSFKNNILVMSGTSRPMVFYISNRAANELGIDANLYFRADGGPMKFSREIWPDDGFYWNSLAEWQNGMNADRCSRALDPKLSVGDLYRPAAGSPALDRGDAIREVTEDFSGAARPQGAGYDIGAHEGAAGRAASRPAEYVSGAGASQAGVGLLAEGMDLLTEGIAWLAGGLMLAGAAVALWSRSGFPNGAARWRAGKAGR